VVLVAALMGVMTLTGCADAGPASPAAGDASPVSRGGLRDLSTALDETPAEKSSRIRVELGAAYYSQGQYTTALDEVKRALNANPSSVSAYNLRGLVYAAMNEFALADDSFERALQLMPSDGDTRHNYGWYLCGARRYPEALLQFGAALALPQYRDAAKTWQAQGVCQARSGDLPAAERSLQRSYALDASNLATAFNLSEVALQLGKLDVARFYAGRINAQPGQASAQSLWLAARIEHKRDNKAGLDELGQKLRSLFPASAQALAYERGQFDE